MIRYITELPFVRMGKQLPRPVVLLDSTGSIGVNTLRIIEKHPDLFQVVALAGGRNVERLIEQASAGVLRIWASRPKRDMKALLAALPSAMNPRYSWVRKGTLNWPLAEASTVLSAQMGAASCGRHGRRRSGKVICLP